MVLLALVVVLFAAVSAVRAGSQAQTGRTVHASLAYAEVGAADTLWSIARRIAPGQDPRETVRRIRILNGLETATVRPGQWILVPAAR